jgi:hypothetical protein
MTPDGITLNYKATMKDLQLIKNGKHVLDLPAKRVDTNSWELDDTTFDDDFDFQSPTYWGI